MWLVDSFVILHQMPQQFSFDASDVYLGFFSVTKNTKKQPIMSIIGIFRLQVDGMMINNITSNYNKQVEMWLKGCILHLLKYTLLSRLLSSGLSFWFWFWFWFSMSISSQLYIAGKRQMNCKMASYWNKLLFQPILWFPQGLGPNGSKDEPKKCTAGATVERNSWFGLDRNSVAVSVDRRQTAATQHFTDIGWHQLWASQRLFLNKT